MYKRQVLEHLFDYSPQERTPETAHALLPTRWNSHVEAHPDVIEIFTSENELAEWMDSAGSLLDNYFHMENPQFLQPVARERFVNARLTSGLAIRCKRNGVVTSLRIRQLHTFASLEWAAMRSGIHSRHSTGASSLENTVGIRAGHEPVGGPG